MYPVLVPVAQGERSTTRSRKQAGGTDRKPTRKGLIPQAALMNTDRGPWALATATVSGVCVSHP